MVCATTVPLVNITIYDPSAFFGTHTGHRMQDKKARLSLHDRGASSTFSFSTYYHHCRHGRRSLFVRTKSPDIGGPATREPVAIGIPSASMSSLSCSRARLLVQGGVFNVHVFSFIIRCAVGRHRRNSRLYYQIVQRIFESKSPSDFDIIFTRLYSFTSNAHMRYDHFRYYQP